MTLKRNYLQAVAITLIATVACQAEFQVNTHTSNKQENPAIAMDAEGNFVVVWNSYFRGGRSNDIFGRRFDSNCTPLSEEFQINIETSGNQREPSVAMDAAGSFVVAWHGPGIVEEDKEDIFARRFDPNAIPISSEFRVNDDPNGRQLHPKVAMSSSGAFAIVWENNEFYPQIDGYEVLYKLYDCNGTSIRADKANLLTQCRYPDAAMNDNGDFVIVWMQDDIYHTSNIIMFRQYSKDGTSKADPCQVSTTDFFTIAHPSVLANGTGYFIVVWDGNPGPADQDNILARRFKFDGMTMSDEFMVNTIFTGTQQRPKVAMNNRGQFIIVWDSKIDPNINERDIFAQRYDSSGAPLGDEFQVNTYIEGDQQRPDVAMGQNRKFVMAWQSYGQDGSGYGIFGESGQMVGSADFNNDGLVNFRDYCILAEEWLKVENPLMADLVDDNRVDVQDLTEFCRQWLTLGR